MCELSPDSSQLLSYSAVQHFTMSGIDTVFQPTPSQEDSCEDERCRQNAGDYVWYCVDCSCRFCESCWKFQPPHREGKYARDGKPHERIKYQVAKRLENILNPTNDREEVVKLHEADERCTWFGKLETPSMVDSPLRRIGLAKDENQCPVLEDFGAYVSLIAESTRDTLLPKYPQLVSFIGETSQYFGPYLKQCILILLRRWKKHPYQHAYQTA
jgi:hypothetical protein